MSHITIATPDIIIEKLLTLLAEQLPETNQQIVLLDAVWMERMEAFPGKKIILFTASADPAYLSAAQKAGAEGFWYVVPSAEALEQVLRGAPSFPEKSPEVQLGNTVSGTLTTRELEVLREIAKGKTDGEIAAALSISVPTVKHHIQQLLMKTKLTNRTQLAVAAVSCGLIQRKNHTFV